jgi:anti-sigma regulatory factor (Ser/Thr protein kinase)
VTIALPQGSLLVLYTDGLTEATRDVIEGDRRLRSALARSDVHDAINPAAAIRRVALEEASDDVAILTMRLVPDFERVSRWSFNSGDAETATSVRREFAAILRAAGASDADTGDAELVFGELLGNVVRHTGGGDVEIALDLTDGAPVLHVLDRGPGFTFYARLPNDSMSESGRGLFIATSFSRDVSVTRRMNGGSHARVVLSARLTAGPG